MAETRTGDTGGGREARALPPAPPEGNSSNNGHGSEAPLALQDTRTQLLMEQLLATLAVEGGGAQQGGGGFSTGTFKAILRRRWLPIAIVFGLTLLAVAWKMRPTEPSYTATATMLLPAGSDSGSAEVRAALGTLKDMAGGSTDTQIAIITSPTMIKAGMEKVSPELREKGWGYREATSATVLASAPVSPSLIDVAAISRHPDASVALANAMIEAYAERNRRHHRNQFKENLELIAQKAEQSRQMLLKAKQELQNYKERTQVFALDVSLNQETSRVQDLEQKAAQAAAEAAAGAQSADVVSDPTMSTLQQNAMQARQAYEEKLRDFWPSAPEAVKARQQWESAQALVDRRVNIMTSVAQARARDARAELQRAQRKAAALPGIEYRLSLLISKVAQLEKTYNVLSDRYTSLMLSSNAPIPTASALTPATWAARSARTWRNAVTLALLSALVLAALTALLLERLDRSVHNVEDLEPMLHGRTQVLGSLPYLRKPGERRLVPPTGARLAAPVLLESCRIIRSNLFFASLDQPDRIMLVTSAGPGEGKSLCALNLATVMAMDGRRVLLMDCDLRRPSQHLLNRVPLEPGLSNVLMGESTADQVIHSTAVENLSIIPAGTLPPNPPELLGSKISRQLLDELQDRFDLILLDSPPVLSLSDAQVLCTLADGVIMVVAADSTPEAQIRRAQSMLRHAGGRLLGVILNKVKSYNAPEAYNSYYTYSSAAELADGVAGFLPRG